MISFSEKQNKLKSDIPTKLNYIRICTGMYVGILFTENGKMVKKIIITKREDHPYLSIIVGDGLNNLD